LFVWKAKFHRQPTHFPTPCFLENSFAIQRVKDSRTESEDQLETTHILKRTLSADQSTKTPVKVTRSRSRYSIRPSRVESPMREESRLLFLALQPTHYPLMVEWTHLKFPPPGLVSALAYRLLTASTDQVPHAFTRASLCEHLTRIFHTLKKFRKIWHL
jgi:hypothetical protein